MSTELPLDPDDVAEIVAILDGSGYARLDVKTARFRLRVARDGEGWTQEWDFSAGEAVAAPVAPAVAPVDEGEGIPVRAPLPGTFYRAPQPGAPPFVEVGDTVGPDTVVAIVETMKLMNPVHAGTSGKVTAILAGNGEMVAADAVLMRIA